MYPLVVAVRLLYDRQIASVLSVGINTERRPSCLLLQTRVLAGLLKERSVYIVILFCCLKTNFVEYVGIRRKLTLKRPIPDRVAFYA